MSKTYEPRTCPTCGQIFTPKSPKAIYHNQACRLRAVRARAKVRALPPEYKAMLDHIQSKYPTATTVIQRDFAPFHDMDCLKSLLRFGMILMSEVKSEVVA